MKSVSDYNVYTNTFEIMLYCNKIGCQFTASYHQDTYHLLTESEVITGKSQTEALMYCPSDSEVNTLRLRSEISL